MNPILQTIDYLIIVFFVVEFLARLWASECVSYYRGWKGKVRFFKNPIRIIDLIVILVSLAVLISNAKGELLVRSTLNCPISVTPCTVRHPIFSP